MTEEIMPTEKRILAGRYELEFRVVEPGGGAPVVFLHDGLGSMGTWKDFPETVAHSTGRPAVAYSREGHGWSDPIARPRGPDFMHRHAHEQLPILRRELEGFEVLIGHSDGASIATIYAGEIFSPSGLVLIAPHVFVERETITGIEAAVTRFETTDLPQRMARYHRDPAATFRAWSDIWLDPAFRDWNIEDTLATIDCPVLLIQARDDEYGTLAQLDAIERGVPGPVERLVLPDGGHSPHLAHPAEVTGAIGEFVISVGLP